MTPVKVKAIAAALLLAFIPLIQADKGQVTFYTKPHFGGHPFVISIPETQLCLNLDPCVNKPMSVKWNNLPTTGKARLAFYSGPGCSDHGKDYAISRQDTDDFPPNFTTLSFDGKASSMMIWESSWWRNRIEDVPCIIRWWLESKNSTAN